MNKYAKLALVLIAGISIAGGYWFSKENIYNRKVSKLNNNANIIDVKKEKAVSTNEENKKEKVSEEIKIISVGNILFHDTQLIGAKNGSTYDFNPSFQYVKDKIKSADLSIGVLETTFAGGKYTGYPVFNSPDEALIAVKNSGIGIVNYAHNHILDSGSSGFKRTLDVTSKNGIEYVGVRKDEKAAPYLIKDIKHAKVGIISYVFETTENKGTRTINSISIPKDVMNLINTFNYKELDKFYKNIDSNIKEMKSKGVNFIVASLHWGEEYDTEPNSYQKNIAKKLNELGVDLLLGEHPHVIQPYEVIKGAERDTLVTYSQGNFLSNQCYERLSNRLTEDGYMLEVTLQKYGERIKVKNCEIIPTWVYRETKSNDIYTHRIIPVDLALNEKEKYKLTDIAFERLKQSQKDTERILGDDIRNVGNFK